MRVAGQHPVATRGVRVVIGGHGAKHRDPVGQFRGQRHQFADMQAWRRGWYGFELSADFGGCIRLGIPRLMLWWTAQQEKDDAVLCLAERTLQIRAELIRLRR